MFLNPLQRDEERKKGIHFFFSLFGQIVCRFGPEYSSNTFAGVIVFPYSAQSRYTIHFLAVDAFKELGLTVLQATEYGK